MKHKPTDEQTRIFDFIRNPTAGNLVVEALAGSGKSTTILESLATIPQRSILITAFNKPIADNLQAKLPKLPKTHAVHVKTFHALGFGMLKNYRPDLERVEGATEALVTRVCAGSAISFNQKRWITKLLQLLKETSVELEPEAATALDLGFDHDIFGQKATPTTIDRAVELALACYQASQDIDALTAIDFADMTWLPCIAPQVQAVSRYQAIMIDELQDISEPQFALLRKVMLPTTRLVAIGDRWQAIYGWRGALGDRAWAIMQNEFKAQTLALSTTFRCCQEVVREANELVPALKALPDFDGGTVSTIALTDLPNHFVGGDRGTKEIHTFVLSRRNDDLLDCALFLHRNGVKFHLGAGKEMLGPLFYLLDFVLDTNTYAGFERSLKEWLGKEQAKAIKIDSPTLADRALQQHTMLNRCALEAGQHPGKIKGILHALLVPNTSGVLLSTVHKVKGLEADRVFLLKNSFARHRRVEPPQIKRRDGILEQDSYETLPSQEELNLEYVAITRARWHLVWVEAGGIAAPKISALVEAGFDPTDAEFLSELGAEMLKKSSIGELEKLFARAERESQRLGESETGQRWALFAGKALVELNSRK